MGFIEREEQKSIERNKKLQEDKERERRAYQEDQDRLHLQKAAVLGEKKRLYRLRREAKVQFTASGLSEMLGRLIKAQAIRRVISDEVVGEDVEPKVPERFWDEMKIKDGLFRTEVIISDEKRYKSSSIVIDESNPFSARYLSRTREYVNTKRSFNIITDSTGLIVFKYGTIFRRHKEVQRSVWGKDSNLLEYLLEKAFSSPRTIIAQGEDPHQSPSR